MKIVNNKTEITKIILITLYIFGGVSSIFFSSLGYMDSNYNFKFVFVGIAAMFFWIYAIMNIINSNENNLWNTTNIFFLYVFTNFTLLPFFHDSFLKIDARISHFIFGTIMLIPAVLTLKESKIEKIKLILLCVMYLFFVAALELFL